MLNPRRLQAKRKCVVLARKIGYLISEQEREQGRSKTEEEDGLGIGGVLLTINSRTRIRVTKW